MNYLFNPYMSKEPVFRLFKPPLECQRPINRLCVKCLFIDDVTVNMTSHILDSVISLVQFPYSTYFSSIISISFHYSTYFSPVFSISLHYSTYFPPIISISFHISSIFSISFHNFLLYFPNLFTIQLIFLS